ncbi:MAG: CDP-alcohol phosphatidyltransferase family protein, partial [Planctomycetota bacterium]
MTRVSHSLLDPWIAPAVPPLYRALRLPKRLPPEAIVGVGHLIAVGGAFAFAFATKIPWAGAVAALAVVGNHLCDMVDGTHARSTGQCRNGGELLDHFADPLSFAAWMVGLGYTCGRLELALVAVIFVFATAVLTNVRAKITGEFQLARFGPTEFKALLVGFGLTLTAVTIGAPEHAATIATVLFATLCGAGVLQLIVGLIDAVRTVNAEGATPDTTEWVWRTEVSEGTQTPAVHHDA